MNLLIVTQMTKDLFTLLVIPFLFHPRMWHLLDHYLPEKHSGHHGRTPIGSMLLIFSFLFLFLWVITPSSRWSMSSWTFFVTCLTFYSNKSFFFHTLPTGARGTELPPPLFFFFKLPVYIFIFTKISLLFYLFFLYLSCSCPYIHTILQEQQLAYADPISSSSLLPIKFIPQ